MSEPDATRAAVVDAATDFVIAHELVKRGTAFTPEERQGVRTFVAGALAWVMVEPRQRGIEPVAGALLAALVEQAEAQP